MGPKRPFHLYPLCPLQERCANAALTGRGCVRTGIAEDSWDQGKGTKAKMTASGNIPLSSDLRAHC